MIINLKDLLEFIYSRIGGLKLSRMDASGNWSLFAGEFFDLVNHFIVGALHLVEKALTDDETDDDANDNSDNSTPGNGGSVAEVKHKEFVAIPDGPRDTDGIADVAADDAVFLHLNQFIGGLNHIITHVRHVNLVDQVVTDEEGNQECNRDYGQWP